jgi:hypothetical protein
MTYLILILNENLLSGIRILRKPECREQIRILERKPQFTLIVTITIPNLEPLKNIVWYTFKFLFREPDATMLLIEILLKLDLDLPSSAHPSSNTKDRDGQT